MNNTTREHEVGDIVEADCGAHIIPDLRIVHRSEEHPGGWFDCTVCTGTCTGPWFTVYDAKDHKYVGVYAGHELAPVAIWNQRWARDEAEETGYVVEASGTEPADLAAWVCDQLRTAKWTAMDDANLLCDLPAIHAEALAAVAISVGAAQDEIMPQVVKVTGPFLQSLMATGE